jgi:hypothetical protein
MEFSDDEQEREYKNRNKNVKTGKPRASAPTFAAGRKWATGATTYTGFYPQRPSYPLNPPAQTAHYMPPAGSQYPQQYAPAGTPDPYQHPNPYPYPQAPQGPPVRYSNYAYAGSIPPPQPQYPPQAYPYSQTNPPAEEESDTVYYDYS